MKNACKLVVSRENRSAIFLAKKIPVRIFSGYAPRLEEWAQFILISLFIHLLVTKTEIAEYLPKSKTKHTISIRFLNFNSDGFTHKNNLSLSK